MNTYPPDYPDHNGYQPTPHRPVDWRRRLLPLMDRRWILVTTFVVILTGTLFWLFKQVPIYRATARIVVEAETMKILNIQDVATTDTRDYQYINTQVKILQSRTMAEQVARSLKIDQDPDFLPGANTNADFAGAVQACLTIARERDSRLINISADHRSPRIAAQLANGLAQEAIRQNLNRKLSASMEALEWLRQQAEEIKPKLQKSEAALQDYREQTHAVALEDRQNIVSDKLKELNNALTKAQTARLAAETEWNQVKTLLDAGVKPLDIPSLAANPQVAALRTQLNEKQVAAAVLRERYKDQYPAAINAQAELRGIEEKLTQKCTETIDGIHAAFLMAKAQEESLQEALRQQEQQALDLQRKMADYNQIKRNAEIDRQLYDSILTRMKETSVTGKMEANNIRLVDAALPPSAPYKPNKTRVILMGIFAGLAAGIALSLFVHRHDDKIKSHEDMEELGLPLLTSVPRITPKPQGETACVVKTEPHSMAAEAFRNMRASIGLSPRAKGAKVMLITSTAPGEGKSLVASNLAIVFANNNERTLLIDADLHHPVQQKSFPAEHTAGLSLFLADSTASAEILQPTGVPNLDIIQAGKVPPNAPELLGTSRMRELLESARQQYDRIIIDTPPITAVSDPLILLPHVDGVVFIVHFNKVQRDVVVRTLNRLRDCEAPLLGAVINNIDLQHHGYYYYPYRYSHYYRKAENTPVESLPS